MSCGSFLRSVDVIATVFTQERTHNVSVDSYRCFFDFLKDLRVAMANTAYFHHVFSSMRQLSAIPVQKSKPKCPSTPDPTLVSGTPTYQHVHSLQSSLKTVCDELARSVAGGFHWVSFFEGE